VDAEGALPFSTDLIFGVLLMLRKLMGVRFTGW
jgi:hypothetical protein